MSCVMLTVLYTNQKVKKKKTWKVPVISNLLHQNSVPQDGILKCRKLNGFVKAYLLSTGGARSELVEAFELSQNDQLGLG